jgi:hypothetical protein
VGVTGPVCAEWFLHRTASQWVLGPAHAEPQASVEIEGEVAWRLFSKELGRTDAAQYVRMGGDRVLGDAFLGVTAVMA